MQVEEESDGERGDGMKLCFLRSTQSGTMWRGGKTGPGILLALRSEYEKQKEKKKNKRKRRKRSRRRA